MFFSWLSFKSALAKVVSLIRRHAGLGQRLESYTAILNAADWSLETRGVSIPSAHGAHVRKNNLCTATREIHNCYWRLIRTKSQIRNQCRLVMVLGTETLLVHLSYGTMRFLAWNAGHRNSWLRVSALHLNKSYLTSLNRNSLSLSLFVSPSLSFPVTLTVPLLFLLLLFLSVLVVLPPSLYFYLSFCLYLPSSLSPLWSFSLFISVPPSLSPFVSLVVSSEVITNIRNILSIYRLM